MKKNILMTAMEQVNDEFIMEASPMHAAPMTRIRRNLAIRWTSTAAGFCLALLLVWQIMIPLFFHPGKPPLVPPPADTSISMETEGTSDTFVSIETSFPPETLPTIEIETPPAETVPVIENETLPPRCDPPPMPTFDNPVMTADEVHQLFSGTLGGDTNLYRTLYVPNAAFLNPGSIPDGDTVNAYKLLLSDSSSNSTTVFNQADVDAFALCADEFLDRFSALTGESVREYEVKLGTNGEWIQVKTPGEKYSGWYTNQYNGTISQQGSTIDYTIHWGDDQLMLNGVPVTADPSMTDEELKEVMMPVKEHLCSLFGIEYSDIKIRRSYDGYSQSCDIDIYFYNHSDHVLNDILSYAYSDNIQIRSSHVHSENPSNDPLANGHISYRKQLSEGTGSPTPIITEQMRLITLEEAEALLLNGCVFGGHSCETCMSSQPEVNFENYDYVGFEYIRDRKDKYEPGGIHYIEFNHLPFYTFYKKTGIAQNGNEIYAKVYVAAFEVSGYDTYLKNQKTNHPIE